jgi:hypothetical protein
MLDLRLCCFPRPRVLYFGASGGGPFIPSAHALHIGASSRAKNDPTRAIRLPRDETEV